MIGNMVRKQAHISELLCEKFVFQLVVRQRDQNILNLQGQILALQNNSPNIQHIGMAGYPPPKFHGLDGGDLHTRNTVPADNNAIANPIVPGHTVWEEDWSISGGRPTLLAPNAPNANAGGNVIAPGIFVGEKIHTLDRKS